MLSEHHDIDHEFPEAHEKLAAMSAADPDFAHLVQRHDTLDNEIREYEECGTPVADETIEKMKLERTHLKDQIYARLREA